MYQSIHNILHKIKSHFWQYTLSFLFIIAYVNAYSILFGPENSIVGVIFAIMMSASMVRDFTSVPLKHFCIQSIILVGMAICAYEVQVLPPVAALAVNLTALFIILYLFTYEYSTHMYFPYILSYLFLVFISPADASQLPKRLLAMLAGAISIMLYQFIKGRNRIVTTARDVLGGIIEDAASSVTGMLEKDKKLPDPNHIRHKVCILNQTVYERRKKVFCISDAAFSMIDAGRGLEHLIVLLHEITLPLTPEETSMLQTLQKYLECWKTFIHSDEKTLPPVNPADFSAAAQQGHRLYPIYQSLLYIREKLIHMSDSQNKKHYRETSLSAKIRLKAALDVSYVRIIYALRTSVLLAAATLLIQTFDLTYGKWLLFTLASVSLPYTDDIPLKMKKRTIATIAGGLLSVLLYTLIPSQVGRTAIMMLSGYISYYLSDYTETFACSTIGALGGAIFVSAFTFQETGTIFLIRLGYVLAGIAIAYVVNCLLFPYNREAATRHLWNKYQKTVDLLTQLCKSEHVDCQLYYHLVIEAHLQEEKLSQNSMVKGWNTFSNVLSQYREKVRNAHRSHPATPETIY